MQHGRCVEGSGPSPGADCAAATGMVRPPPSRIVPPEPSKQHGRPGGGGRFVPTDPGGGGRFVPTDPGGGGRFVPTDPGGGGRFVPTDPGGGGRFVPTDP